MLKLFSPDTTPNKGESLNMCSSLVFRVGGTISSAQQPLVGCGANENSVDTVVGWSDAPTISLYTCVPVNRQYPDREFCIPRYHPSTSAFALRWYLNEKRTWQDDHFPWQKVSFCDCLVHRHSFLHGLPCRLEVRENCITCVNFADHEVHFHIPYSWGRGLPVFCPFGELYRYSGFSASLGLLESQPWIV